MIDEIQFKFKDKVFILLVICGLSLAFYFRIFNPDSFSDNNQSEESFFEIREENEITDETIVNLEIENSILQVEIAISEEKKVAGLSNKEFLTADGGMLFVFSQKGSYVFEMRDMNFDLDFIFIKDDEIIDVKKSVSRNFEEGIRGNGEYDKVLEVNAGWFEKNGIKTGSKISWKIK